MKRIDTARWQPSADNPNKLEYAGQKKAQEVFAELEYRLRSTGYLPDEYLNLNIHLQNGEEFPDDADILCSVNWGGNEGIYLDIMLRSRDEKGNLQYKPFATGKTLGESESDLDRMYLIASACTKAFHSDGEHARFVTMPREGEPAKAEETAAPTVIHLNEQEKKIVTDSLIETRYRLKSEKKPFEQIEQLLRQIIGNITEYIKAVGERPQNIDYGDMAYLAIHDGHREEFQAALPHVPHLYGNLLAEAVNRPDYIGRDMAWDILKASDNNLSNDIYKQACYNAIHNKDIGSVHMLSEHAETSVKNLDKDFYGDLILHALTNHNPKMANQIADGPFAVLKDADPHLLKVAIMDRQYELAKTLISNGIDVKSEPAILYYAVAKQKNIEFAHILMEKGADPNGQNSAALAACMQTNDVPSAMFLIKCGANFDNFMYSIKDKFDNGKLSGNESDFVFAVQSFWDNLTEKAEAFSEKQNDDNDMERE